MALDFNAIIQGIINFISVIVGIFIEMIEVNPMLALLAIGLSAAIMYFLFQFIVNTSWSLAHAMMYLFFVLVLGVILYIAWSQFGIGASIGEWLMTIFKGGIG